MKKIEQSNIQNIEELLEIYTGWILESIRDEVEVYLEYEAEREVRDEFLKVFPVKDIGSILQTMKEPIEYYISSGGKLPLLEEISRRFLVKNGDMVLYVIKQMVRDMINPTTNEHFKAVLQNQNSSVYERLKESMVNGYPEAIMKEVSWKFFNRHYNDILRQVEAAADYHICNGKGLLLLNEIIHRAALRELDSHFDQGNIQDWQSSFIKPIRYE